jgi:hypothetical protein
LVDAGRFSAEAVTSTDEVGNHELGIGVQGRPRPDVASRRVLLSQFRRDVLSLSRDKRPDLVGLHALRVDVSDHLVMERLAELLMRDLESRLADRTQLTTDQLNVYLRAVDLAFHSEIDYAMLHKVYASVQDGRYSPPECIGTKTVEVSGSPDPKHISTSYVERSNLTMRMSMRRFTRLTNGFSKKLENHAAMVALYFMYYNFGRVHQTLRVTPAMEAGIADHVWSIEEIVSLLNAA